MKNPVFLESSSVDLVNQSGDDLDVIRAARVSVHGVEVPTRADENPETRRGLINHMMKNRHGSVFEHNLFTFRVSTPIFVAREFMRHRMFSYNEESARYRELEPKFWVPRFERKLRQEGKPSAYRLVEGTASDYLFTSEMIRRSSIDSYSAYRSLLDRGIAREVARAVLPVNTFTSFYATCNARALMSFLSLRIDCEENMVPTHPQAEIQQVAEHMEGLFYDSMPETFAAFTQNGRAAP